MIPALLLASACASVNFTAQEISYIRHQQTPLQRVAHLGTNDPGRKSLIARGEAVLPCLEEIYRTLSRDPREDGELLDSSRHGLWALYIVREIDPDFARKLVYDNLQAMPSSDKRVLHLAVLGHGFGLQGHHRPSAAGRVVQYMDQCTDPADMMDVIHAISFIRTSDLRSIVKARLGDNTYVDLPEVRQGLQLLLWGMSGEYPRVKNEIRTNPQTSRFAATLLCNLGQAWIVDQILKEGTYPEEVDLAGVLDDARRLAAELGDELAQAGTWP